MFVLEILCFLVMSIYDGFFQCREMWIGLYTTGLLRCTIAFLIYSSLSSILLLKADLPELSSIVAGAVGTKADSG